MYERLHRLAHEAAGGRWVATGGGGYQLVEVVPRAWTLAFAQMTGGAVPPETPMDWQVLVRSRTGIEAPDDFGDRPATVSDEVHEQARRAAEEAVAALRTGVLARHGA
jgi:acetoin utilization protein AcuC